MQKPKKPKQPRKNISYQPRHIVTNYLIYEDFYGKLFALLPSEHEKIHELGLEYLSITNSTFPALVKLINDLTVSSTYFKLNFSEYRATNLIVFSLPSQEIMAKEKEDFDNRFEIYERDLAQYNIDIQLYNDYIEKTKIAKLEAKLSKLKLKQNVL